MRGCGALLVDRLVQGDKNKAMAMAIVEGVSSSFEDGIGVTLTLPDKSKKRRAKGSRAHTSAPKRLDR